MRKINTTLTLNQNTFNPQIEVFVVNEDGTKKRFTHEINEKYTPEQAALISRVNFAFSKNSQDQLTEEEIEYLVRKPLVEEPTEIDLQKLAGFTVEKKIIYDTK